MAGAPPRSPMTSPGRVHIVGAGLAGLAAAVALSAGGRRVALYEASQHAGGRCRSFFDSELGCRIDNGNHLLLAGNTAALAYIERIGALDTFERPEAPALPFVDLGSGERWELRPNPGPLPWRVFDPLGPGLGAEAPAIPFVDLGSGERWELRPNPGPLPWWLFDPRRRVPGTSPGDYLQALRLRRAPADATVAGVLDSGTLLFRRLWQPFAVAALNTSAKQGSARLFWRVLVETLGRGGAACRGLMPREGLSESLIDPALALLRRHDAEIRFGARLRGIDFGDRQAAELLFDAHRVSVGPSDSVILAAPASVAARLVPGLTVPGDHAPILHAHYRYVAPAEAPLFAGLVGGTAEWVFRKPEVVSVTVSAADRLVDDPADSLAERLWGA